MKFRYLYVVILIAAVACMSKNMIRVSEVSFTEEISLQQNLVFTFNKPLVEDSLRDQWDSTAFLNFTPAVEGRYKWITPDQLMFSPLEGFKPFTDYEVSVSKNIQQATSENFNIKKQVFKFSTPALTITGLRPFWTSGSEGLPELHLFATFNYSIDLADLASKLSVSMGDKPLSYSVTGSGTTAMAELVIGGINTGSLNTSELSVVIQPGMGCINGTNKTREEINASVTVSGSEKLEITDIVPEYNEGTGIIRIYTNQSLTSQSLDELIDVTPISGIKFNPHQDGIAIEGDFLPGSTYRVTISPQLTGILGDRLNSEMVREVTFGELTPMIAFDDQNGIYLSSAGEKNLGVRIINVPKVKMTVFRIFENNILEYLRRGKSYEWYEDNDSYYDSYTYPLDENYGTRVFSKTINTVSLPRKGNINLLNIKPSELRLNDRFKGMYLIKIESVNERYLTDVALVSFSDIGLMVKKGKSHYMVFARSIVTGQVIAGVTLDFISRNNQKVFQTKTDSKGVAWLKDVEKTAGGFEIAMITATKDDDFTFIKLDETAVETSRFETGGKNLSNQDYDVFVYGQRNLYRPGDSAFMNLVARTPDWKTPDGIPLKIKVISPTGREFLSVRKTLDKFGAAEVNFYLPNGCNTGRYVLEAYTFDDVLLNSLTFSVEEFSPDRIKLNCKTDKKEYSSGEPVAASLEAFYFYGPPASGRKVEMELQLTRSVFTSKEFRDYNFNIGGKLGVNLESSLREGVISEEGKFSAVFSTPAIKGIGLLKASLFTSVFDDAGKAVNYQNTFNLFTQDVFFGIQKGNSWVASGHPFRISFIALDKNGKTASGAVARVVIIRKTWETVARKEYNRISYISEPRETMVLDKTIRFTGGKSDLAFTPGISGEYEVRIMPVTGEGYVNQVFYAYGGDASFSSFRVDKDGQVEIKADKDSYAPGEKAGLLFTAPFSGDLFVTVEQEETIEYHYLKLENKAAKLDLLLKDNYVPNVYISATAMIKSGSQSIPLMVAHGYHSVQVSDGKKKLPVNIECTDHSGSGQTQSITVKTAPNALVTIAVVDEGILQITRYATPDPYDYFYSKRALGVDSYDIYPWLYPEIKAHSSTGAAEPYDLGKRVNPLTNRRVKLVTYWSGNLKSDKNGMARFNIGIPQFSGSLRVMAAAFSGASFGSAEKTMKVADDIVITSAFPLFLSPGDKVTVPVTLANTTSETISANLNIITSGPVTVNGSFTKNISIAGGNESRLEIPYIAGTGIGKATVIVEISGKNKKYRELTDITVRPASGLETLTLSGSIEGGNSKQVQIKHDFLPQTISNRLIVSRSPVVGLTRDLSFLVQYPYGCTEQVISSVFPQLYLEDLMKLMKSGKKMKNTGLNVTDGIRKIEQLQLTEGGWNLWPGMEAPQNWVSVYALNFLIEARKAGFEVNEEVLRKAVRYVEIITKNENISRNTTLQPSSIKSATPLFTYNRETMYALYVLALSEKPNMAAMNFYKSRINQLTTDSRFLLAAAYALTGNLKACQTILPNWPDKTNNVYESGNNFSSGLRDLAISLNALLVSDPGNLKINGLAGILTDKLQNTRELTTQEAAFAVMALGKLARFTSQGKAEFQVLESNRKLTDYTSKEVMFDEPSSGNWIINTRNSGKVWYFAEVSGISAGGNVIESDNYLKIRKEFYTRDGKKISPSGIMGPVWQLRMNDLIVVKITLESLVKDVDNLAITDLLPACFQIENQRLAETRTLSWADRITQPVYFDIREDRIHFFTDIHQEPQVFYYQVRVTAKGEFRLGPVSAEGMYVPVYHSVSGSGKVVVH